MPAPLDEPARKVPINLYEVDVQAMENLYGRGWTEVVRNLVRYHVKKKTEPRTVGELFGEES